MMMVRMLNLTIVGEYLTKLLIRMAISVCTWSTWGG